MTRGPRKAARGPRAPRRRPGLVAGLLAAFGTVMLFAVGGLVWGYFVYFGPGPSAREGQSTIVTLQSGSGVSAIAASLRRAGVIRSTEMFKAAAALTNADRRLRAGEYEVPDRTSLHGVLTLLTEGRVIRHFVTLPEGRSSAQAVDILMAEPVLTGTVALPPEGALWPETYEVTRGESRAAVVARMRRAADENLARMWARRAPDLVVRTSQEALILASIVEKETGLAAERPRVAAVFSNRLRAGMRLESDPTIVYGVNGGRPLGRGIRMSELQAQTPYNTYQIAGLPPTPIANPGEAALAAVLNPPRTDELFFVADGTGGHVFARTFDEHLRNVARWRGIERARAAQAALNPPVTAPATDPAASPGRAVITLQDQGTPVRRPPPAVVPVAPAPPPAGAPR